PSGGRPFRRAPITSLALGSGGAVIRGGRNHMNLGDSMISIPGQPDATPSSLAIWLATGVGCPANSLVYGHPRALAGLVPPLALGERCHRGLARHPLPVLAAFRLRSCASRRTARASCTSMRGGGARLFGARSRGGRVALAGNGRRVSILAKRC